MTAPPKHGSIERGWRDYREQAMPKIAAPSYLRASRLAFYSGCSMLLAELVLSDFDVDTIDDFADELEAFVVAELAAAP